MRYAEGHKEKTRAKILEAAGRVFRRRGYHATGVDKVMEEAGLTAGGFYAHFRSKEALLAETLTHSTSGAYWRREAGAEGPSGRAWLKAFLGRYLSRPHRENPEAGCALAALVSEASRADDAVKASFEAIVRDLQARLASHAEGIDAAEDRTLAALALCIGGLGMARAVRDEAYAGQILDACRAAAEGVLGVAEGPPEPSGRKKRGP